MTKNDLTYSTYNIIDKQIVSEEMAIFKIKENLKFSPGQFVQIALDNYGEATFAPCSDAESKSGFELCIRAIGNTTKQLIKLLPGDTLKIRGPYGNSWPVHKLIGKNILIIAGGMGLIPLRPLIFEILKYRKEFKKIHLIAGFKTDQNVLFEADLLNWKKKFNETVLIAEHVFEQKGFECGLVTEPIEKIDFDPKNTIILMCGPEIMFNHCINSLQDLGVSDQNIYISFERRMECGIGICQHCNIGKYLVCKDGPVFRYDVIKNEIGK